MENSLNRRRSQEKINKLQKSGDGKENNSGAALDPSSSTGGFEGGAGDGSGGGDRVGEKLYTGRNPGNELSVQIQ